MIIETPAGVLEIFIKKKHLVRLININWKHFHQNSPKFLAFVAYSVFNDNQQTVSDGYRVLPSFFLKSHSIHLININGE